MATITRKFLGRLWLACLIACTLPVSARAGDRPPPLRISAVGDIMLGGTAEPVMEENGYDYPFQQVKAYLKKSDIVIGNLEGPLTDAEVSHDDKPYVFKTPPDKVAPALKRAGFNLLNLANNHIMDFGVTGLQDTLDALKQAGIASVGAGKNLASVRQGTILEKHGQRIGFLSYSLTFPEAYWADTHKPGTAFGHETQIREDVARLKQRCDLVLVSFHWGGEKTEELRDYQPLLAHAAIDSGAVAVLGHHPHVLQAVEQYHGGIIFYSLGNFTFGSYSRAAADSVIATMEFEGKRLSRVNLVPLNVLNVEVNFQPQPLQGEAADAVIEKINRLSSGGHTRFTVIQNTGTFVPPTQITQTNGPSD